jgi:hypothetical protein
MGNERNSHRTAVLLFAIAVIVAISGTQSGRVDISRP